ncbi:hypothetical protein B0H17DRAFT_1215070 [Mycena rosella]|uniref:Uncharacterized protein n=1 Tax=Mycena rosella TaxID=1033263 RepID=A0AAD7CP34_MYCRO|nr:hypothetical protein B0H17DRAFT_1215070 [Mycena rosella]
MPIYPPRPPVDPRIQPLSFLQGSRCLPPTTSDTAPYLSSISALVDWNTLCSLRGHVETLAASLRTAGEAVAPEGRPLDMEQYRLDLAEFLIQRSRCKWSHIIPATTGKADGINLEEVPVSPLWIQQVSQVINIIPECWNGVQYRVLLSYLQQSSTLDSAPYEFELTCRKIQASLKPGGMPIRLGVIIFADSVRRAVRTKNSSPNHVDMILGILLSLFDANPQMDLEVLHHWHWQVTDSIVEYLNDRNLDEAICYTLQDCNLTRVWKRITARLSTCRPDFLGDVSKAVWHLASLFPGLSSPDARLSTWPHFITDTLSVIPATAYSASVMALIKTHVLNAYDDADIFLHLQAFHTRIDKGEKRPFSDTFSSDWALMTTTRSLLLPFAISGRPVQLLEPFPERTNQAYRDWRAHALAVVSDAIEFARDLDEQRMGEVRLAIATEFIQGCSSTENSELPYKAAHTFSDILKRFFISQPAHPQNQKDFAAALRGLAETPGIIPELFQVLIDSPLFQSEEEPIDSPLFQRRGIPWLNDLQAVSTVKSSLQTDVFVDSISAAQNGRRNLKAILDRLEALLV